MNSSYGSSGSDIVLVTKAISCNHSFKVLSSLTSANALISGLDPSACLVLAAIGSLAVVWLLVLEAIGSSLAAPTGVSVGSHLVIDRIPSTTPGAEPPRDAKDSGSARSHSTHLETSSSNRP